MNIQKVKIGDIKPNKENPRTISNDKRKKLIQSIKDFPQMLEIRPIVVDDTMTILGGNMRYDACKEAGLNEIWIIKANDLTEEQKKEFILKDNNGFGEWDLEKLVDWDKDLLLKSGFEEWQMIGIFGENELENKFKKELEGSNFIADKIDVNDYIKQNIIFLNELMLEFEDDEVKESIRNIKRKEAFQDDLKKLIKEYGQNRI
jgi:arsenate reductase-like glutaredoxin family protein